MGGECCKPKAASLTNMEIIIREEKIDCMQIK